MVAPTLFGKEIMVLLLGFFEQPNSQKHKIGCICFVESHNNENILKKSQKSLEIIDLLL